MNGTPPPPPNPNPNGNPSGNVNPNGGMPEMEKKKEQEMNRLQSASLKLCFCPLCDRQQYLLERQPLQWPYLAMVIIYCIRKKLKTQFINIKTDILPFIYDHMYVFANIQQFNTPQQQWFTALCQEFNNPDVFILSEDKQSVGLKSESTPWENEGEMVQEISASSNIEDPTQQPETDQIQNELRESYKKTLQIAKVAYLTCQKALFVYTDDTSKSNILAQMEELQKVITETNYLLGFFQK